MVNWKDFFSETVIITMFLSYIILVMQEVMGILGRVQSVDDLVVLRDPNLWTLFFIACLKYLVILISGIFTRALKSITGEALAAKTTENQQISAAYLKLQQKAIASGNPELVEAARNTALDLIGKGVDLFDNVQNIQANEITGNITDVLTK